jgi:hypothetical protein
MTPALSAISKRVVARSGLERDNCWLFMIKSLKDLISKYRTNIGSIPANGDNDTKEKGLRNARAFRKAAKESFDSNPEDFEKFVEEFNELGSPYRLSAREGSLDDFTDCIFWAVTIIVFPGVYHHLMDDAGLKIDNPNSSGAQASADIYGLHDNEQIAWFVRGLFNLQCDVYVVDETMAKSIVLASASFPHYLNSFDEILAKFAKMS